MESSLNLPWPFTVLKPGSSLILKLVRSIGEVKNKDQFLNREGELSNVIFHVHPSYHGQLSYLKKNKNKMFSLDISCSYRIIKFVFNKAATCTKLI